MNKKLKVFLYVPNLIDYLRLILLIAAWMSIENTTKFLFLYISSKLLDGVDGWAARKFNQVTDFGAWLDVVIDIIGRGLLWCHLGKFGYAVPAWEWMVFVANHARSGSGQWKEEFKEAPYIVKKILENGFKNVYGYFVFAGIDGLPVWLYIDMSAMDSLTFSPLLSTLIFYTLLCGRLLGSVAEIWCVYVHVLFLAEPKTGLIDKQLASQKRPASSVSEDKVIS